MVQKRVWEEEKVKEKERKRQGGSMIDNGADRTPLAMLSVAVWGDRASPRETELPLATVPAHTPHLVGSPTLGQRSRHHGGYFRTRIPRMLGEQHKACRGPHNNQRLKSTSRNPIKPQELHFFMVFFFLHWPGKGKEEMVEQKICILTKMTKALVKVSRN